MNHRTLRLALLHQTKGMSRPLLRKLLDYDEELTNVFKMEAKEFSSTFALPFQKAVSIIQHLHSPSNRDFLRSAISTCTMIPIWDEQYPPQLRSIPDAPLILYVKGDRSLLLHHRWLSVVGARKCSNRALPIVQKILPPLINEGIGIVSGMADGIDSFAHEVTMAQQGNTIAVLAFGFEHCYPKKNKQLMKRLSHQHLLISEYAPHIEPKKWHFPERNRIISGLGRGTLVVEARERSGTLITVDQALEQGKDVFAVPGSILDEHTSGCHKLIQDGAKLVQNAQDILEEWESSAVK